MKSRARGADEAADDYDHKAQGGELNDDLCCHLTEAAPAGNQLSKVGELVRELAILPHIIDLSQYLDSVVFRSLLVLYVWRGNVEGRRYDLIV